MKFSNVTFLYFFRCSFFRKNKYKTIQHGIKRITKTKKYTKIKIIKSVLRLYIEP